MEQNDTPGGSAAEPVSRELRDGAEGCRQERAALPDPDVVPEPEEVGPDDPAGLAIRAALARDVRAAIEPEVAALALEVEGVHELRKATRRLRADLRAFRTRLDEDWYAQLKDELRWLAHALGAVRDIDVIREVLRQSGEDLLDDLGPLFEDLDHQREVASRRLRRALTGERFRKLRTRLIDAARCPPLRFASDGPCREVLPALGALAWKRLKKAARGLGPDSTDPEFHEARKRAKDARHAAESLAPALPSSSRAQAESFADHLKDLVEDLGLHQDAVVARGLLETIALKHPGHVPFHLATGRLLERQALSSHSARTRYLDGWDRFDRKKHRRWLRKPG